MLSPQAQQIFYGVAGAIVAILVFRIWWKNRAVSRVPAVPRAVKKSKNVRNDLANHVAQPPADDSRQPAMQSAAPERVHVAAYSAPAANQTNWDAPDGVRTSWHERHLLQSEGIVPRNQDSMPRILPEDIPGVDDSDRTFGSWLNPAFASLIPESEERREEARHDLAAAGFYNPHALENLAASRYAFMMLGLLVFGSLVLLVPSQLEPFMVACCILAPLLGWALPALYVRSKAKQRLHEIERAMPDLLDMLNMCVGQGLTVPDSLQRIGRDFRAVYPALSQELSIVNEQARITTMQTALENLGHRINLPEVHSLTSLLIQTERMGTSISQALTTYSDTMRESQKQQADEKGNRATFRLLFPTVLCLMPAVYLFLLGPAINELQRFFYGGGMDSFNNGSQVVQRVNATRNRGVNPASGQSSFNR